MNLTTNNDFYNFLNENFDSERNAYLEVVKYKIVTFLSLMISLIGLGLMVISFPVGAFVLLFGLFSRRFFNRFDRDKLIQQFIDIGLLKKEYRRVFKMTKERAIDLALKGNLDDEVLLSIYGMDLNKFGPMSDSDIDTIDAKLRNTDSDALIIWNEWLNSKETIRNIDGIRILEYSKSGKKS